MEYLGKHTIYLNLSVGGILLATSKLRFYAFNFMELSINLPRKLDYIYNHSVLWRDQVSSTFVKIIKNYEPKRKMFWLTRVDRGNGIYPLKILAECNNNFFMEEHCRVVKDETVLKRGLDQVSVGNEIFFEQKYRFRGWIPWNVIKRLGEI